MSILGDIQRRQVFQVAAVYAVVAWLLVQVADVALAAFNAPSWIRPAFIFFMILGFPITLVMSWAFNLAPEGLVREEGVETSAQCRFGKHASRICYLPLALNRART